jgi:hypothetical protein
MAAKQQDFSLWYFFAMLALLLIVQNYFAVATRHSAPAKRSH